MFLKIFYLNFGKKKINFVKHDSTWLRIIFRSHDLLICSNEEKDNLSLDFLNFLRR